MFLVYPTVLLAAIICQLSTISFMVKCNMNKIADVNLYHKIIYYRKKIYIWLDV